MVEIIFIIVATICIIGLFAGHPFGRGTLKPWLNTIGILLVATPGVLTLIAAFKPLLAEGPFGAETKLVRATAVSDDVELANHFLLRAFQVVHGDERHPAWTAQRVVRRGEVASFDLADGADLTLQVRALDTSAPHRPDDTSRLGVAFECKAWTWTKSGTVRLSGRHPAFPGDTNPVFEARLPDIRLDRAPIGALLTDRHRESSVILLAQPLKAATDVEEIGAEAWWRMHADAAVARFRESIDRYPSFEGQSGSSWNIAGDTVTPSAVLILIGALLLFLMDCRHWFRILCVFALFSVLYVGAIDRLSLRMHEKTLGFDDERTQAAAVVDAAGSRLHPVTAAERLLAVARDGGGAVGVREVAVGMMTTRNLLPVLRRIPTGERTIRELVDDKHELVRAASRRVLEKLAEIDERAANQRNAGRGRAGADPSHRPRGTKSGTRSGTRRGPARGPERGPERGSR